MTEYLEREVLRELEKEYGSVLSGQHRGLAAALREIYVETDRQFVFLIDEWDCVMRERQESEDLQMQAYLQSKVSGGSNAEWGAFQLLDIHRKL